jgi:FemAB-related protein (PEP-CTERM system-associated)
MIHAVATQSHRRCVIRTETNPARAWARLGQQSDSALAHAPEWFAAIRNAYGHEPLYLSGEDEDGRWGVLPAFIVRRPLFGTVVTSMPFLDTGGPSSASPALAHRLVERLVDEAVRTGARAVELRCTRPLNLESRPQEHKVGMTLSLPGDSRRLWRGLDGSVRNQVRKAERSGLSVETGAADKLEAFYDVFAERMRDLGSPVHACGFFRATLDAFGSRARIVLVRTPDTVVGGLLAVAFGNRVAVPWAAARKEHFASCPNMLMYWEALRSACDEGFRWFDFGRSTRGSGTYRFEQQWGATDDPLFWYTIPLAASVTEHASQSAALAVTLWQRLPLAVTRRLGPHIRQYLTQ